MKILALCKRQYTGKDLLDDRYGRLHELPVHLAGLGASLDVLVLSYRRKPGVFREEANLRWHGAGFLSWPGALRRIIRQSRPEVILASSDAIHVILGSLLGRILSIPVVVDLYDDYEAFGLTRIPSLTGAYRKAYGSAALIITVSQSLADVLASRHTTLPPICVIRNGVPPSFACPLSKAEARRQLGLPAHGKLIGTAGALSHTRGIADLFTAWQEISAQDIEATLVIAGPRDKDLAIPATANVIDLGQLPHDRIPALFHALDVGIVCNKPSRFGQSCHPQKLAEMIACALPVVAADVGEVSHLLREAPFSLYPAGDHHALAKRVLQQIKTPQTLPGRLSASWQTQALALHAALQNLARS